jgi:hypothetical protein
VTGRCHRRPGHRLSPGRDARNVSANIFDRLHGELPWWCLRGLHPTARCVSTSLQPSLTWALPLTCFPAWTFAFVEIASRYPRECESFMHAACTPPARLGPPATAFLGALTATAL